MTKRAPWTTMPQYAKPATAKARKYIRSRTPARAKEEREYTKTLELWIVGRRCQLCGSEKAECHHKFGRKGRLLLMVEYWIPLCAGCHGYVHEHPEWARERRLLAPIGQFNSVPRSQP